MLFAAAGAFAQGGDFACAHSIVSARGSLAAIIQIVYNVASLMLIPDLVIT
jgi:exosortase/archaeosortase